MEPAFPECAGCRVAAQKIAELEKQAVAQLSRSAKRQAAPFSKGAPKADPRKPGRKPGADYGTQAFRQVPPHIDEVDEEKGSDEEKRSGTYFAPYVSFRPCESPKRTLVEYNVFGVSLGTLTVDEFTYTFDADGNVLTKDNALDGSLDEAYTYDNLNRLTSTTGPTDQSWDLDALGNFDSVTTGGVTQDDTTNAQNELTEAGTHALAYDNAGNMTTDDQGDIFVFRLSSFVFRLSPLFEI